MKINSKKICLLGLYAILFLYSSVAVADEDGVCRVTTTESIVNAYTGQSKDLEFRFRWHVEGLEKVTTNLAGIVNNKFNLSDIFYFDKKNRLKLFFGNYIRKGIFYHVEKTIEDNGNITLIKVYFSDAKDKSHIWEATNLLCEVTTDGETQYFPPKDSTIKYFRDLSRPTTEE